jgi:hypothetical protein
MSSPDGVRHCPLDYRQAVREPVDRGALGHEIYVARRGVDRHDAVAERRGRDRERTYVAAQVDHDAGTREDRIKAVHQVVVHLATVAIVPDDRIVASRRQDQCE